MKPTLALSSLVTLALLLVAAVQENFCTEWRVHQRAYGRLLLAKARDEGERAFARRFSVEIRQIVVPDLDAVDRCVSCHLGFDDPRMRDVPEPFRAHRGRVLDDHDADRFGCTVCHGGQGRATTKREAHADEGEVFWERPLLAAALVQSSCGVCHDPAALGDRGARALARGYALFREKGCLGCHKLEGRGGILGPSLDDVGDKGPHALPFARVTGERTLTNWHRRHLEDPQKVVPGSKMPKIPWAPGDVEALTTYLLSLRDADLTARITPRDKYEERYRVWHPGPVSGAELYQRFCVNCHGEGVETLVHDTLRVAVPSVRNPDFLAVASEDLLFKTIRDGRPETDMPAFGVRGGGLSDGEIRTLVNYLLERRERVRQVAFDAGRATDPVKGRRLFDESCSTCHGLTQGVGDAPWLGGPGFQETYSDALIGHTIKYGRAETLMNPYGREAGGDLDDQQISDLVAFVRAMGRRSAPSPATPPSSAR